MSEAVRHQQRGGALGEELSAACPRPACPPPLRPGSRLTTCPSRPGKANPCLAATESHFWGSSLKFVCLFLIEELFQIQPLNQTLRFFVRAGD